LAIRKRKVFRSRLNSLTLVPWCAGKALTWDVTAVSTLADSYVVSPAQEAGAPAELAVLARDLGLYCVNNNVCSDALRTAMRAIAVRSASLHALLLTQYNPKSLSNSSKHEK